MVPLVTSWITMSFRRIGVSRSGMASAFLRCRGFEGPQQLGADGQLGRPGRLDVDAEAHLAVFGHEPDHPGAARELVRIADRENAPALQARHDLREAPGLRLADEEHVAQ